MENDGLAHERDGSLTEEAVLVAEFGDGGGLGDSGFLEETVKETAMAIVEGTVVYMGGKAAHAIVRYDCS